MICSRPYGRKMLFLVSLSLPYKSRFTRLLVLIGNEPSISLSSLIDVGYMSRWAVYPLRLWLDSKSGRSAGMVAAIMAKFCSSLTMPTVSKKFGGSLGIWKFYSAHITRSEVASESVWLAGKMKVVRVSILTGEVLRVKRFKQDCPNDRADTGAV